MASSRRIDAFVRRLEDRIAEAVEGHDRVALAYSGGLASTLVAMLARKRCALECIVAGVDGSADVLAAKAGKARLDYRVEFLMLNREDAARTRAQLAAANPTLQEPDLNNLVPLGAVLEHAAGRTVLSGFGLPPLGAHVLATLERAGVALPIRKAAGPTTLSRSTLRSAAASLGLPPEWARVRHRAPADGAGMQDLLRGPNPDRPSRVR